MHVTKNYKKITAILNFHLGDPGMKGDHGAKGNKGNIGDSGDRGPRGLIGYTIMYIHIIV